MPAITILLFTHPVKQHLVYGPRKLLTLEQLEILRIYCTILALILRCLVRKSHLQVNYSIYNKKISPLGSFRHCP